MDDDYYDRIDDSNLVNRFVNGPEWYKLLLKNTAGALMGLMSGGIGGLVTKITGYYEEINMFIYSGIMIGVYD